jgi:UV DNA damage endonuclease
VDRRGRPYIGEIYHAPWPLQPAAAEFLINTMAGAAAIRLPDTPPLLHFVRKLEVIVWPIRPVEARAVMTKYLRLGFPVKVLGEPLRSHDSRRWQNAPHLSVSLAYLRDVFGYLHRKQIRFYRLAGQLAPYLTHPGLPAFHCQLDECATELAATGDLIREYGLRVTLHPAHYVQLNAPDAWLVRRAEEELGVAAALLDAMGLERDAVIVVHVGGVHGDAAAGRQRFVARFLALPEFVRRRLVLEHDDRRYSFDDALWIHRRTSIPLVLDTLHLRCLNPTGRTLATRCRWRWRLGPLIAGQRFTSAARARHCARCIRRSAPACSRRYPTNTAISSTPLPLSISSTWRSGCACALST